MLRRYLARRKMRWAVRYLARMPQGQRHAFRSSRMFVRMINCVYVRTPSIDIMPDDNYDRETADAVEAFLLEALDQLHT